MIHRKKASRLERDLVEGLEEFLAGLKSGTPIDKMHACRRLTVDFESPVHEQATEGLSGGPPGVAMKSPDS
ncbi:MAG: hypothetical protein ABFC96_02170 [Thermoguttaceae bacterium]